MKGIKFALFCLMVLATLASKAALAEVPTDEPTYPQHLLKVLECEYHQGYVLYDQAGYTLGHPPAEECPGGYTQFVETNFIHGPSSTFTVTLGIATLWGDEVIAPNGLVYGKALVVLPIGVHEGWSFDAVRIGYDIRDAGQQPRDVVPQIRQFPEWIRHTMMFQTGREWNMLDSVGYVEEIGYVQEPGDYLTFLESEFLSNGITEVRVPEQQISVCWGRELQYGGVNYTDTVLVLGSGTHSLNADACRIGHDLWRHVMLPLVVR